MAKDRDTSGSRLRAVRAARGLGARGSWLSWSWRLLPFVLLATANSAGYRYGASDLAFYGPAVMRQLDPSLFPRDRPIIDAQARLTFMDETVAAIARLHHDDLPALFLGLYLLTLVLLAAGIGAIGARSVSQPVDDRSALLAAITLRHAIAKSGTNSLEGYFHPRQLAFAFGTLAIAAFLRGRTAFAALALLRSGIAASDDDALVRDLAGGRDVRLAAAVARMARSRSRSSVRRSSPGGR